jgi:restriction system protein
MAIPDYQAVYKPLLEFAADGREHALKDAVEYIAQKYELTPEERNTLIPSRGQRLLENRVGWGRTYLTKAGLLESPRRGVLRITERGRTALSSGQRIDNRFLRQFPEFVEFMAPRADDDAVPLDSATGSSTTGSADQAETTPEEMIEKGYDRLRKTLVSDLRDRLQACSPAFFERLVVELLVAMGYGGSLGDAGKAIGRSGDHGIDGIIKEDRLGLDVIYVQAKRWTATIGRPEIQQFAGALQGQRARKGVFISTSSFSSEARDYAAKIETRIVLIDGAELANLMITHGVGVSTAATYELKKIDSDYFVEEEE